MDVVSFFAGCGGLDLGFEQAGFRVVWANDLEPHCRDTYIRNHPNTKFVLGDMRKIDPNLIPECVGFIGGPPCQPWSIGGKQAGLEDERGQLFLKYIEFIDHDLDIDFNKEMNRIQSEMKNILAKEEKSQSMLVEAFRGIGYEIK